MNRTASQQKNPPQHHSFVPVQKVINQRILNGKKQYKVIWVGKTFEQATWEPQENLNCEDKIAQFLKRYQQVMKKKNLLNKQPLPNQQKTQPTNKLHQSKITLEKPETGLQQKLVLNQSKSLNKEKLQASISKRNSINQAKPDTAQQMANSSASLNTLSIHKQIHTINDQQNTQPDQTPNKGRYDNKSKLEFSQKNNNQIEQPHKQIQFANEQGRKLSSQSNVQEEQETAETQQHKEKEETQQMVLNVWQRLDIVEILGTVSMDTQNRTQKQKQKDDFADDQTLIPRFFMIKSRFHPVEKIVSSERIKAEQPLKLIQFYQTLITQSSQIDC